MSLKCSLFGHRFGEPEVQRERAEQGSEVVTTIREVAVCDRCGQARIVSENTEVTTLETPDTEPVAEDDPAASEGAVAGSARADDHDDARDAEVIEDETTDPVVPDAETEHPADSVAQVSSGGSESTPDPDADVATPEETDDGVILEEAAEEVAESQTEERQPGQWPEASEGDEPDWVSESSPSPAERESGSTRIDGTGSALTVPDGQFHCPECGFSTAVESSSLREGDFCPECHQGVLDHRPDPR